MRCVGCAYVVKVGALAADVVADVGMVVAVVAEVLLAKAQIEQVDEWVLHVAGYPVHTTHTTHATNAQHRMS